MNTEPVPPPEGWSLREAAAALFPEEWMAASLPDDKKTARKHPGIEPRENPLAGISAERAVLIVRGSFLDVNVEELGFSADELPIVERYRAFEAEIEKRLASARKAAERAKESLPRAFADRMIRGDFVAYGIEPHASLNAPPTVIRPHLWAVARPHLGFDPPSALHDYNFNWRPTVDAGPEPDSVSGLPGVSVLRGVRIRSANDAIEKSTFNDLPAVKVGPVPPEVEVVAASLPQAPIKDVSRNRGGRPKRDDWPLFNREAFRRMALDGGNLTLRGFRDGMTEWAEANMTPPPDESTIRRYIEKNFDTTVFAPE